MLNALPTPLLLAVFATAALAILLSGLRLTGLADRIADRTGLGEAIIGAVLLGASTSIGGTIVSVTAALDGNASLAFSNSVGGIAAQTAFLAVADLTWRRANLEHAGAEPVNLFQAVVLSGLLALPLVALTLPEITLWAVHPVSFAIPAVYLAGLIGARRIREEPMWRPVATSETREDRPEDEDAEGRRASTARLLLQFAALMLILGFSGWVIARCASALILRFDLSASLVGALATATVTSLPELVTTVAAVRRGALQLAIGGIIGGNAFDMLFLPAADIAYRGGSLYHAATMDDYFWVVVGLAMTALLLAGLILRQRAGPGRIGVESAGLLAIYAAAIAAQVLLGGAGR